MHRTPTEKLIEATYIDHHQLPFHARYSPLKTYPIIWTVLGFLLSLMIVAGLPERAAKNGFWVMLAGSVAGLGVGVTIGWRRRSELARLARSLRAQGRSEIIEQLVRQSQEG